MKENHKRRVLIIDDEPSFTRMVKLALAGSYEVAEENVSRRSVETARKFKPDLILLDVIMPEHDGGDVLSLLRSDRALKHIPVLFLTATVARNKPDEPRQTIGGHFFVAKPVSANELIHCIDESIAP